MDREQYTANRVIGRDEYGEIVVLDSVFRYHDDFQGATGSTFQPVNAAMVEEAREDATERYEDIWREVVKDGGTTLGLDEWTEHLLEDQGDDALFDTSYESTAWPAIRAAFPEYADETEWPLFDCRGGGRMFSEDRTYPEVVDPHALEAARLAERGQYDEAVRVLKQDASGTDSML